MRAQILTAWTTDDDSNAPQLPIDHALPAGASWMDATGQATYQIPTQPNSYVVEVWHVTEQWLDDVAADDNYLVLWSAEDDAEPSAALTTEQLDAIRGYFADASAAQVDHYVGTAADGRSVAEVADAVREWSSLFMRQDEMPPEDYVRLVNRYPAWQVGTAYAAGELVAYNDALYEVVQAHASQEDWPPDQYPALYKHAAPGGVIPEWIAPTGAHDAYQLGDKVTYNGQVYVSVFDGANVWRPDEFGWELVE